MPEQDRDHHRISTGSGTSSVEDRFAVEPTTMPSSTGSTAPEGAAGRPTMDGDSPAECWVSCTTPVLPSRHGPGRHHHLASTDPGTTSGAIERSTVRRRATSAPAAINRLNPMVLMTSVVSQPPGGTHWLRPRNWNGPSRPTAWRRADIQSAAPCTDAVKTAATSIAALASTRCRSAWIRRSTSPAARGIATRNGSTQRPWSREYSG